MFYGNKEHYEKIKEKRKELGLDTHGKRQIDIENSTFLNKTLIDVTTQKEYSVKRDYKQYSITGFGWYKVMLIKCENKYKLLIYENINNDDVDVNNIIENNKLRFDLN